MKKSKTTNNKKPVAPKVRRMIEQQEKLVAQSEPVKPVAKREIVYRPTYERTRLRVGDVLRTHQDGEIVVTRVTPSAAVCVPMQTRNVEIKTLNGKQINFQAKGEVIRISANSEHPILRRLGPDGLAQLFKSGNNEGNGMSEKKVHAGTARQQAAEKRLAEQRAKAVTPEQVAEVAATKADEKQTEAQPAVATAKNKSAGKKVENTVNKNSNKNSNKGNKHAKSHAPKSITSGAAAKQAWETMRARNGLAEKLLVQKQKVDKVVAALVEKFDIAEAKAKVIVSKVSGKLAKASAAAAA